jgi:hypothetical protein
MRRRNLGTLEENIISTSPDLPENLRHYIFNQRENGSKAQCSIFFPLIGKRDMPGTASEEEKLYL